VLVGWKDERKDERKDEGGAGEKRREEKGRRGEETGEMPRGGGRRMKVRRG